MMGSILTQGAGQQLSHPEAAILTRARFRALFSTASKNAPK